MAKPQFFAYRKWFINYEQMDDASALYDRIKKTHDQIASSIQYQKQKECNVVAKMLNQTLIMLNSEEQLQQEFEKYFQQAFENSDIVLSGKNLGVSTNQINKARQDYYNSLSAYKQKIGKRINEIEMPSDLQAKKSTLESLEGAFNTTRGDVYEHFLKIVLSEASQQIDQISEGVAVDTVKDIMSAVKSQVASGIKIKVEGRQMTTNISGGQLSKGKVDVKISEPGPFMDWSISAKNYARLRDIELGSGVNVKDMIEHWGDAVLTKYYLNSLSIVDNTTHNLPKFNTRIDNLIGLQLLSSHKGTDYANVLIVNTRNTKSPTRILSIEALASLLTSEGYEEAAFGLKYNRQIPLASKYEEVGARKLSKIAPVLPNLTVTGYLKKKYLTLSFLKKLANS